MTQSQHYYLENLYPFQNDVLQVINGSSESFYLTGGTALSRGYLNHRFSDDLDLFSNDADSFASECKDVLHSLEKNGFVISDKGRITRDTYLCRYIQIPETDTFLHIDFVRDINSHFGNIEHNSILGRIDNIHNILSNKVGALIERTEVKDVVDLWGICKSHSFDWNTVINEAKTKESSVDVGYICNLLLSLPESEFNKVSWIKKPDFSSFCSDIENICQDMTKNSENTLFQKPILKQIQKGYPGMTEYQAVNLFFFQEVNKDLYYSNQDLIKDGFSGDYDFQIKENLSIFKRNVSKLKEISFDNKYIREIDPDSSIMTQLIKDINKSLSSGSLSFNYNEKEFSVSYKKEKTLTL